MRLQNETKLQFVPLTEKKEKKEYRILRLTGTYHRLEALIDVPSERK
jgi:hypothetical protein